MQLMNHTLSFGNGTAFGVNTGSLECDAYDAKAGRWGGIECAVRGEEGVSV